MKQIRNRFRGLYWRQLFVTVGMVMVTLGLLGASFFALSYNYARNQRIEEIKGMANVISQMSVSYLENGRYLTIEELQEDPDFQRLASFAATVSDVNFMICDEDGRVLLATDQSLSGRTVTMPEEMTREIMEEGSAAHTGNLEGV